MSEPFTLEQLEPSILPPPDSPQRIVAEAQGQAEQIREQARAQGYEEGLRQGMRDGAEQITSAARSLNAAMADLQRMRDELARALEGDAVELSLALAEKIVAGTLELEPERVLDVVRGALRRLGDRRRVTVMVDPADLPIVDAAVEELRRQVGGSEPYDVRGDRRVGRGGAVVRTSEIEVDVRIRTQLERARELAFGTRPGAGPTATGTEGSGDGARAGLDEDS